MQRQKTLLHLLNRLDILLTDLNRLLVEYDDTLQWEGKQIQEVEMESYPWKMVTDDEKYFYVCMPYSNCVARYTMDTLQLVDKFKTTAPNAIEISGNELYVSENNGSVKVFNILPKLPNVQILRQWKPTGYTFAIKVNNGNFYYANALDNQIYVYNLSGKLIKQFGKSGSGNGELNGPYGIDIDDQSVYVADYYNSRVQVFHLLNYTYSHQWGSQGNEHGEFRNPYEIRLDQVLCYVGDMKGVQVFTKSGEFLYRFGKGDHGSGTGEFFQVRGILIVDNRLYVSDHENKRLVVLK